MLRLASQNLKNRTVLVVEHDDGCAREMAAAIAAAGGRFAGCVSSGMSAVAFARREKIDCVMIHTETLHRLTFSLGDVMKCLNVVIVPVTSFDEWYDLDDEEEDQGHESGASVLLSYA